MCVYVCDASKLSLRAAFPAHCSFNEEMNWRRVCIQVLLPISAA